MFKEWYLLYTSTSSKNIKHITFLMFKQSYYHLNDIM